MFTILFFFLLSYGIRFCWDSFLDNYIFYKPETDQKGFFWDDFAWQFVVIFDGISFLVLLLFHLKNFTTCKIEQEIVFAHDES